MHLLPVFDIQAHRWERREFVKGLAALPITAKRFRTMKSFVTTREVGSRLACGALVARLYRRSLARSRSFNCSRSSDQARRPFPFHVQGRSFRIVMLVDIPTR